MQARPEGLGISYPPSAILGEISLDRISEEASEGTLKRTGFFDTVNIGDGVLLAAPPAAATPSGTKTPAPTAPAVEPRKDWPGLFTAVGALR